MSAGSTRVVMVTRRPVAAASLCSNCTRRSGVRRHGRRHFRANDLPVFYQPLAIDDSKLGQQRQPLAIREDQYELSERRRRLHPRDKALDHAPLGRHRHGRIGKRLLELRIAGEQGGKRGQFLLHLFRMAFPDDDVEECSRVAGPRTHECSWLHLQLCELVPEWHKQSFISQEKPRRLEGKREESLTDVEVAAEGEATPACAAGTCTVPARMGSRGRVQVTASKRLR